MCLKKKTFLKLLKQFPEAQEYYLLRAKARRIEFKRLRKQFKAEFDVGSDGEEEKIMKQPDSAGKEYQFVPYKQSKEVNHLNDPDFFFKKDTTTYLNEQALEEFSEDERPHEAYTSNVTQKNKEATAKLVKYYDQWIEEAQRGMMNLFNNIGDKYEEVAQRLESVGKREAAQKEKFKSKMKANFEVLNQLSEANQEI